MLYKQETFMAFIKLISFCISRSTTVRADSAGIWSEVDKVEKLVETILQRLSSIEAKLDTRVTTACTCTRSRSSDFSPPPLPALPGTPLPLPVPRGSSLNTPPPLPPPLRPLPPHRGCPLAPPSRSIPPHRSSPPPPPQRVSSVSWPVVPPSNTDDYLLQP